MGMTRHRAIHGAVFAGILLLAVLAWGCGILRFSSCYYCDGKGWTYCDLERTVHSCRACPGAPIETAWVLGEQLTSALTFITGWFWVLLGLGNSISLVWALRQVDCRLCGGEGRVYLEAVPVDASAFEVEAECAACEGRGRLGMLDRWVFWNGWERKG